jgi:hypothetical protein
LVVELPFDDAARARYLFTMPLYPHASSFAVLALGEDERGEG